MAKTIQDRKIQELADRLAEVRAERDSLQAQIGHLNRFLVKVLLEAQSAQSQIKNIGGAPDQQQREAKIE